MGREDFSQSSQLTTLVGKPTNRYKKLPKNVGTIKSLTQARVKPNNRLHYSAYPLIQKEYSATYTQLTNLDFYSPIITILGNNPVSHLVGAPYVDAGVKVDEGSELYSTVSTIDTSEFGTYSVVYKARDGINADTTMTRVVKVGMPPDATINGQNPATLEKFDVYTDDGITVTDSNSALVFTTSTVNNIEVGTYTVNYTVSNPAFTEVFSRTVRVDDTVPPVITITGGTPYELERFDPYVDEGATVDLGSELTNTDLSQVQNTAIGSFNVVYTAYDGNTTVTATRTVNVVDTVPPVITILGDDPYTLERFDVYTDEGATVDTGSILTTDISAVNNALTHGSSFVVTYTATDGNVAHDVTQTRTVNIVDTKPPVITLLGDVDPYHIQPLIPFQDVDPGFEVDLGTSVSVDYSSVVTTDNSNFDVVYRASDGVNPDAVVIRRVAVADTLSPVVILNGPSVVTLERYAEYVEQSVTLDLGSSLVSTITDLDNTTVGSYTVTYLATDNINPDTTNVRIINVVDTTAPIVTLNGASSVTLERYGVFADIDSGVTIDANGTLASVDISQLNNTTQGTYTVTYNVVDDHNNANVITREVVVEDTIPPVVTLNNESTSYTLERYGDWSAIDPGVTVDRGSYVDSVTVDNTSTGLKVVTYTVNDGTNTTQKNRVITVIDTVAPVGSINNPSYQLERLGIFVDPGVTGLDAGTYLASTDTGNVDNTLASGSTFDVIYDIGDGTSNTYLTRTVTVVDTTAPVITLTNGDIGTTNYTVERGTTYVDPGATADTGEAVTVNTSQLNMAVSGTYTVTYSSTDADGNIGTASRTVIVDDVPVITLVGSDPFYQQNGFVYTDSGASADGGETVITDYSAVNTGVNGTYTAYYSTDSILVGTATRTVNVGNYPTNLVTTSLNNITSSAVSSDGSVFVLGASGGTSKAYYSNGTQKGGTLTALKSNYSGYSCDISANGNRIIIGEPNFFGIGGGNARVYDWNGTSWSTTDFGAPSGYSSEFTGESVAISNDGNTVLICDYNGTGVHIDSGWIYVARYNGSSWSIPFKLSGASSYEYFGYRGDMSGDATTIVVATSSSSAPIYTYRGTPGSYTLVDTISTGSSIRAPLSLSSDGNTLAVHLIGTVRIYSWNPSGWTQLGLDIATSSQASIRLSGDGRRLVLGDSTYNSFQGISRVYEWTGLVWSQVGGNFVGSSNQEMGKTVSVNYNGDRICTSWLQGAKLEQIRSRI